jgi:hypothetical protein
MLLNSTLSINLDGTITFRLPCDLEANKNEKHDDESGVEPVPGPSQYGASEQVGDDDMAIITEEVEEDIVIQENASEFDVGCRNNGLSEQ